MNAGSKPPVRRSRRAKTVTLREVAADAGVSTAAVSRAFTPGARIADETRNLVFRTAERLGYRPSRLARSLSRTRSDLVALLVGDMATSSFDRLFVDAVLDMAARLGRHTLVFKVAGEAAIGAALDMAQDYRAAGVIVAAGTMTEALSRRFEAVDIPLVLAGRAASGGQALSIVSDNRNGAGAATRHVIATGARRLVYVGRRQRVFCDGERLEGVAKAMAGAGLPPPSVWRADENTDVVGRLRAHLTAAPTPDALICFNDRLAIAALEAAASLGIDVPGRLRITGYDDIPEASWESFRLTTVPQPIDRAIAPIEAFLSGRPPGPGPDGVVRIPAPLLIRRTA